MYEAGGVAVHDPKVGQCSLPVAQELSPFTAHSWPVTGLMAHLLPKRCSATLPLLNNACSVKQLRLTD